MVRMDLVAALRNALDRGYTLQQAKRTLISSGYGTGEIETAAKYLTGGVGTTPETMDQALQYPEEEMLSEEEQIKQAVSPKEMRQYQPSEGPSETKKPSSWLIIFLVIVLIILLGGLALIFIFRNNIMEFIQSFG